MRKALRAWSAWVDADNAGNGMGWALAIPIYGYMDGWVGSTPLPVYPPSQYPLRARHAHDPHCTTRRVR